MTQFPPGAFRRFIVLRCLESTAREAASVPEKMTENPTQAAARGLASETIRGLAKKSKLCAY